MIVDRVKVGVNRIGSNWPAIDSVTVQQGGRVPVNDSARYGLIVGCILLGESVGRDKLEEVKRPRAVGVMVRTVNGSGDFCATARPKSSQEGSGKVRKFDMMRVRVELKENVYSQSAGAQ